MAAKISICRFSSQDPLHRAENILNKAKKWLCHKDDKSGRLEAELHLPQSIKIGFINIGNCGSAFIEISVGCSIWPTSKEYKTLLPSTMLMGPKGSNSLEEVKMFNKESFVEEVTDNVYDRIRVILRQPYNKNKQFGLRFIDVIPTNAASQESKSKPSPKQSLAAFRSKFDAISSPSGRGQLQHPPSMVYLTPPTCSRATGLVQAALKGQGKDKLRQHEDKTHQKHKMRRTSPYQGQVDAQLQRRKSASRRTAGDIEDEVECFLESFDFKKLPLESITYRHLLETMESLRGEKLNKQERKIFLKLAKKYVLNLETATDKKVLGPVEVKSTDDEEESSSPPIQFPMLPTPPSQSPPTSPLKTPNQSYPPSLFKSPTKTSNVTTDSLYECPLCDKFFPRQIIEFHASTCVGATISETIVLTSPTRENDVEIKQVNTPIKTACDLDETVPCPFCNSRFPRSRINVHANVCVESGPVMSF